MQTDVVSLQRRVAALEAAVMICVALFAAGAGTAVTAQGPSRVVAPFSVVDGKGRELFKVQMSASGAGLGIFYDESGAESAVIGFAEGSEKPTIQVFRKGVLKAGIGFNKGGDGLIRLNGANGQQGLGLSGEGIVEAQISDGPVIAAFGADKNGHGMLFLKNRPGQKIVDFFGLASGDGFGQLLKANGDLAVAMGTKENGKADVCANGTKGQVCLGLLAAKTMTPW